MECLSSFPFFMDFLSRVVIVCGIENNNYGLIKCIDYGLQKV